MPNYFCNDCGMYLEFQNYHMFTDHKYKLHDRFRSTDTIQKRTINEQEEDDYLICLEHQLKVTDGCSGHEFCGKYEYQKTAEIDLSDYKNKHDDVLLLEELKSRILESIDDKRIGIKDLIVNTIKNGIAEISVTLDVSNVNLNHWIKRSYLHEMLTNHNGIIIDCKLHKMNEERKIIINDITVMVERFSRKING